MTDDTKLPRELGDIDWDQALEEWEKESFLPEVAKDAPIDKPADRRGTRLSRPLYQPPTAAKTGANTPRPLPSPLLLQDPDELEGAPGGAGSDRDEDDGATIVAAIPRELLRRGDASARPGSRGGLGQLFAREERRDASAGPSVEPSGDRVTSPHGDTPSPQHRPSVPPAGSPPGPFLIVPQARHFDPDDVTKSTHLATEIRRPRREDAEDSSDGVVPPARGVPARRWTDEKPASEWLTPAVREAFASRATWLESEARVSQDPGARARGLLACSEILATMGEFDRARALASEARELVPSLELAHWQTRGLMASPPDREAYVEALDAAIALSASLPAKIHGTWLAAEALRDAGQDEAVAQRLEYAARLCSGDTGRASDVRPIVALAVRALARGESASPALRLPHTGAVAPIAAAAEACLRLRGADRKEPSSDESPASELLLGLRQALKHGETVKATLLLSRLGRVPELFGPATWLAAAFGATRASTRRDAASALGELSRRGDGEASGALMARAIELGDPDLLVDAMTGRAAMTSAERVAVTLLGGIPFATGDSQLEAAARSPGMEPLAAAAAAVAPPAPGHVRAAQLLARAELTAGTAESRAEVRLGRLLSTDAPTSEVEVALRALSQTKPTEARALALELAARGGRALDVAAALESWGAQHASEGGAVVGSLAAALVAERAGDLARAVEWFKAARAADPKNEAALRAIASLEQVDLVGEANALADDLQEGLPAALARLEAVTRGEEALPEPTRADLLERAHRAAPSFPIAAFLSERIARRSGDVEEALRWVRERRAQTIDPTEVALDNVREALLLADREPALAAERLERAHHACPGDVALRALYERMTPEPLPDRGAWREERAGEAAGDARTLFLLDAAREHERIGDDEAALRCAEAASGAAGGIGRIARERAELRTGRVARLAEDLLAAARDAKDADERCEAYGRLAELDGAVRADAGSALLWHRAILEELPAHLPSLRHVEHHLIGEGRDEELEPIASAIARVLRGSGPGECTAHAEIAARLRARGAEGNWEATREMAELAAAEAEPSLWSLRLLQAHARARGDDATFLNATLRLVDRAAPPAQTAALLVRAGEAAMRLERFDEARSLLERATTEDPGDVVAWELLVGVRRRAGDHVAAAEACEALARSSLVPAHQLAAWHEAACIWSAEGNDEDRAMVALETAAAIDAGHGDTFERLSSIYVSRKMQAELAALLERRLVRIPDARERLAMEVRRGQILLEVGDGEGARRAFESALADHPDDGAALSAFADLCLAQRDWETAERALVRLARLLPTVEEQRRVYSRLGDLYAGHLLNLSRAEVAFNEVLKRAPGDAPTMEKLVDIYRRQSDPARALPLHQQLIALSGSPGQRRDRIIELGILYEQTAHDNRRAEQTFESARREFPLDVAVLRATVEFYTRQRQPTTADALVDRAGEEGQRLLALGRMSPQLLELVATVSELRGNGGATMASLAMLAALEGRPGAVRGAGSRAFEPGVDELLAPEVLSPALRALLRRAGHALDAVSPVDLRGLDAIAAPAASPLGRLAAGIAQAMGLGEVQVLVSSRLGPACIPIRSSPPLILAGAVLAGDWSAGSLDEQIVTFLVLRALKLVSAKAAALTRTAPAELGVLVGAWLKCFYPGFRPQDVDQAALSAAGSLLQAAMPRQSIPELRDMAVDVTRTIGTHAASLGGNALAWANRVALLALGNASAALDAIASSNGSATGAPRDGKQRLAWVSMTAEARDLLAFGAGPRFAEAQSRLKVSGA